MNWTEGLVRGARTFFQTFAGALAGVSITDVVSKSVAISIGMKLLGALLASAIAGLAAVATNLGTPAPIDADAVAAQVEAQAAATTTEPPVPGAPATAPDGPAA